MEYVTIGDTGLTLSRVVLGTWAIGGWMWGGTDERDSIETIHAALDKGVTCVDTAPVYGFGKSEEIVGRALAEYGKADQVHVSTKATLDWTGGGIVRNGSRERILREVEDSLNRLGRDRIDVYYVHWPDCSRPIEETAAVMRELYEAGTVRAVGVSNYTPDQMRRFASECPLHCCQPPYNLFERGIEADVKPWCQDNGVALMPYGALCRGLLSGKMTAARSFSGDDLRKADPKFNEPRFEQYLAAAEALGELAGERYGKSLLAFAVRWVLEKGSEMSIWGGRKPSQMDPIDDVFGWSMDLATLGAVDTILAEHVKMPVGAEFMAPPTGVEG